MKKRPLRKLLAAAAVITAVAALVIPLRALGTDLILQESASADPFSFFVGKVTQQYTQDQSKLETMDMTSYIDRDQKEIRSVTGELSWDYGEGLVKINTPRSQGVVGFLKQMGPVELDDVVIESQNDYAAILVIALDDKPLPSSSKILIQAMTEDKPYGWKTEGKQITDLGGYPLNVRNIEGSVTLKGRSSVSKISVLDENGYEIKEIEPIAEDGSIKILLPQNAIYTVIQ